MTVEFSKALFGRIRSHAPLRVLRQQRLASGVRDPESTPRNAVHLQMWTAADTLVGSEANLKCEFVFRQI